MRYPNGRVASYVHELGVREELRRRGIGRLLIENVLTHARDQGNSRVWLSTGAHNKVAQALYESLGGDREPLGDVNYWWNLAG